MMADMREVKGKAIANQGDQIKKVNDHSFKVKSQSGQSQVIPFGVVLTS